MTHFFSSGWWRGALVLSIALLLAPRLFSQCNPDVTPPTVSCLAGFEVSLNPLTGQFQLFPTDILEVFQDDCCTNNLKIKRAVDGPCDADAFTDDFADDIIFCCADAGAGPVSVVLRGYDCAGNFSECNTIVIIKPDVTPPVAVCKEQLTVSIVADDPNDCYGPAGPNDQPVALPGAGIAWVHAQVFDDGSYDVCNNIRLSVRRLAPYSNPVLELNSVRGVEPCDSPFPTFPSEFERAISEQDSIKFYCGEAGAAQTVILRAYQVDATGHFMLNATGDPIYTECQTTVTVEEKEAPIVQMPPDVTVSCKDFDPTLAAYGAVIITDNCCIDHVVPNLNYSLFDTVCYSGTITRSYQVFDCSGNSSTSATQTIVVNYIQDYYIKFPDDVITSVSSPTGSYGEPEFLNKGCELIGVNYNDEILLNQPDCDLKIVRIWTVLNWCTYDDGIPWLDVPNPNPNAIINHPANLPGPTVSQAGTAAPWTSTVAKINASDPAATDFSTFWDLNANGYRYTQIIKIIDSFFVAVQGKVFSDTLTNCSYDNGETPLESWTVRATGQSTGDVREAITDANGEYLILLDPTDTVVTITLVSSSNFGQNCQTEYTVHVPTGTTATQDVPVHLEQRCALMSVGITTPRLRRCFTNEYKVQAFNLSGETVAGAYVEVTLDDYLDFNSSSIPGTLVSGNTYSFPLGDLAAGDFRDFTIQVYVSCEAPFGATHCTEARVYPYDDCRGSSSWSGADVEVNAVCDGDSVRFAIKNVGDGAMTQLQDFVVVEDVVMRQQGTFQLGIGQTLNFSQPANGSTWRLQAEEEPLHPWGGLQAVALEGCGGLNNTGLVNLFPLSDPDPFEAMDCTTNIAAYDPNDKQGFPTGYGNQHLIEANTDIEYLIRFQNTGTDTAFTVVLLDSLAQTLEASSVRVEVASHPMSFTLLEGGILRFSFENILLPDSNVNQAASNGFVKFRAAQKPGLALGTVIENRAAIYFDFNEPVLTNTTVHTIGDHFLSVSTDDIENDGLLRAYPNPVSDAVFFDLKDWAETGRFELSNSLGQQIASERFTGKQFRFDRKNLPAGIYTFQIMTNSTKIASGKIVLK